VIDVNHKTVKNASVIVPVTHTRPGADAKYAFAQSRSVKERTMMMMCANRTSVTAEQWPCATALCMYIIAKSGVPPSVISLIVGCFDENATTVCRTRFATHEHKTTNIAHMSVAMDEVPPTICMIDMVPTPNIASNTDSIAQTNTPPVARMVDLLLIQMHRV
jgi:hypothetical protein